MELGIDNATGAIAHLNFGGAGAQVWASGARNATLFDLRYQTYNDRSNLTCNETGCPNPIFGSWSPELVSLHHNCSASGCSSCRVVAESRFNETWSGKFGSHLPRQGNAAVIEETGWCWPIEGVLRSP